MKLCKQIEKNFPEIEKFLTAEQQLEFSITPTDDFGKYDFGLGTMIRVGLLRSKSTLYKRFAREGFTDRDLITKIIITEFQKYIRRKI